MPQVSPGQVSFNGGLLSNQIDARDDIPKYANGCSHLTNWLPEIEGPVVKRPGSKFIAPQRDENSPVCLVKFEFSVTQTYQLEFGDGYLRVFRNQSLVLDSSYTPVAVDGVSATNAVVVSVSTTASLTSGDMVYISGTNVPEINDQFFSIVVTGGGTFELNGIDGTTFSSQVVTAGTIEKVYSIVSPYASGAQCTIHSVQSLDVLYIASDSVQRQKLSRIADDDWTFTPITGAEIDTDDESLGSWPPFADLNTTDTELYIIGTPTPGASITVMADTAGTFAASDVGRYIMLQGAIAKMGYALITAFVASDNVTVTVYSRFPDGASSPGFDPTTVIGSGNGTKDWAFSAFDETNGYPKTVTFYDDRLYWASTPAQAQTFWASVSNDYENHRPYGPDPTDPDNLLITGTSSIRFTPLSEDMNAIEWMVGLEVLFVGTRGGEWIVAGQNPDEAIGPTNLKVKQRGHVGSRSNVRPVAVDEVILFVQRAGRKLKELIFQSATSNYTAIDMTRLSREILLGRVSEMSYQQEPNKAVWVVNADGTLRSFTYERADDVVAWANQELAGTDVEVESVSVLPSANDDEDEVWISVKRTIDSKTRRYIEVLQKFWDRGDVLEDAFFVDSGLTYSGSSANLIYGLLHLIGETVSVWGDGAAQATQVISEQGTVTLETAVEKAQIGLGYNADLKTMRLGGASDNGTSQGKLRVIDRVVTRVDQASPGLLFGPSFDEMDEIDFRDPEDLMDTPVPLYDGNTDPQTMPGGYDQDGFVAYRHPNPGPCSIKACYPVMYIEEGEKP